MRISTVLSVFATATLIAAKSTRLVGNKDYTNAATKFKSRALSPKVFSDYSSFQHQKQKRQSSYLNYNSQSTDA